VCLRSSLHACHSTHSLRLSNTNLLSTPFFRISFGSRSISVAAPKIWNSPLYLSVPVPVLTPSVVISRPTTASRPSTPLYPSPLAPQIRLCWPLCTFINYIYLLIYLISSQLSRSMTVKNWLPLAKTNAIMKADICRQSYFCDKRDCDLQLIIIVVFFSHIHMFSMSTNAFLN